jgi:hypothetical protein
VKMPIDWHKECLENWTTNTAQEEKRALQVIQSIAAAKEKIAFYESQIARAEKEGRKEFDADRFGVKSSPRS